MICLEQADKFFKQWVKHIYEGDVIKACAAREAFIFNLSQFENTIYPKGDKSVTQDTK